MLKFMPVLYAGILAVISSGLSPSAQARDSLIVDRGAQGLWEYNSNASWVRIYPSSSPDSVAAGDLDGNGIDEVITGSPTGIRVSYNNVNSVWARIHGAQTEAIATGDLDGNGKDDLIVDFGAGGLYVYYNNATWVKLSTSPFHIVAADLDRNGKDEIIADFASGLWVRYNNIGAWIRLHATRPERFAVGDVDGNGKDDLIVDFWSLGLYIYYNNTGWLKLNNNPIQFATGDLNGNGKDEIFADLITGLWTTTGLWTAFGNPTSWVKLHTISPTHFIAGDLDANGKDELIVDFGASLWGYYNNTNWVKLSSGKSEGLAVRRVEPLFPSPLTTGVPTGWVPKKTYTSNLTITTAGAVIEDARFVNASLRIAAANVIVRRVEIQGGQIITDAGGNCKNGVLLEDVSVVRRPGQVTNDDGNPAIGPGGYTARRVKIDGLPEGFRVGGKSEGCTRVTIEDSFARVVAPGICGDWHGDALQGYDGPALTLRNVTLQMVERSGCYGTAAFFYPLGQGNTSVDIARLLVLGGGYPFRLGLPGPVRGLRIPNQAWSYGPINVKCSVVTAWDAQIVTINSNYQPSGIVRAQPCNTQEGQ